MEKVVRRVPTYPVTQFPSMANILHYNGMFLTVDEPIVICYYYYYYFLICYY